MVDFQIQSSSNKDESRAITFQYTKNGTAEVRKLYIKPINTNIALQLSEIFDKINLLQDKINENQNENENLKYIREMYNLFKAFLKISIINYDENEDLINDFPVEDNFIKSLIEKIQEKMSISNTEAKSQKKTQKRHSKKRN